MGEYLCYSVCTWWCEMSPAGLCSSLHSSHYVVNVSVVCRHCSALLSVHRRLVHTELQRLRITTACFDCSPGESTFVLALALLFTLTVGISLPDSSVYFWVLDISAVVNWTNLFARHQSRVKQHINRSFKLLTSMVSIAHSLGQVANSLQRNLLFILL